MAIDIGDRVHLTPAPLPGSTTLRQVQDGAGNFGRFLPDAGAARTIDPFWHDRLTRGDVHASPLAAAAQE